MRRSQVLAALVLVVVVVGQLPTAAAVVATPGVAPPAPQAGVTTDRPVAPTLQESAPPDPENDTLGWENGFWANESIAVDQSDGLTDAELRAFRSRAMARVEAIRGLEFESDIPVEIISRETFQERNANFSNESSAYADWNNQVWEALFIVGENRNTSTAMENTTGSSVAGYYSPSRDSIVVVSDDEDELTIDNATLVHELTHAIQNQQFNLSSPALAGDTQDTQLSTNGLTEGEANLVEALYERRCRQDWSCVSVPSSGSGGIPDGFNWGIYLTIFQPYSDGPVWVDRLRQRGGWAAVDAAYDDPPASTEQIIHLTNESVPTLTVADEATNGWERFPDQGVNGSDTAGEASIFTMFWYQSAPARLGGSNAGVIDWRSISQASGPFDVYNYEARPSAGWGNDRIVPYRNGDERGYVWKSVWDTRRDARQFHDAYGRILSAHDAEQRGPNTYVIPEGRFADAFYVERTGATVLVVNAPTVADLPDVHPAAAPDPATDGTATTTADDGGDGDGGDGDGDDGATTTTTRTTTSGTDGQSGFGIGVALAAVLGTLIVLAYRRRL